MLGEGGFVRGAGEKIRGGLVEQAEFVGLDGVEINFGSGPGSAVRRAESIQPQSARNSRLMRRGLPAKAEELA